ncbi:MAG: imidazoleglycerol-phosphate dehydratase [Bacillota bacterium]
MRAAECERVTKETRVNVKIDMDNSQEISVETPLGWLNHLLYSMAYHGRMGLSIRAFASEGFWEHHLAEDVGIGFGIALRRLAGRSAIARFGHAKIPHDEACADVTLDISGRSCFLDRGPRFSGDEINGVAVNEFLLGLTRKAEMTLHVSGYGEGAHHYYEALFKALGRAMQQALAPAESIRSTKGMIHEEGLG